MKYVVLQEFGDRTTNFGGFYVYLGGLSKFQGAGRMKFREEVKRYTAFPVSFGKLFRLACLLFMFSKTLSTTSSNYLLQVAQ